jgi:ribonuclease HI
MGSENVLVIYTDGSSLSKPRAGGIGIMLIYTNAIGEDEVIKDFKFPGYKGATNNQMELKACIDGLQEALKFRDVLDAVNKIIIRTDSKYITSNYKTAMFQWSKTKWLKRSGGPVLNADLWKELIKCIKKVNKRVDFVWVKSHSKDKYNKAVDKLAKESAKSPFKNPLTVVDVRRKKSPNIVEVNSVKMRGQRIAIRIITSEYLKVQKIYKYKYEVISKRSKYFEKVDLIFYKELLRAGHSYLVSFNKNSKNPMISKVTEEL